MGNTDARGMRRITNAFGYSMAGLRAAYRHEEAFRQEVWLAAALAPLALWLGETGFEKGLLLCTLFLVLITELLNSAVEAVVDRVSGDRHDLSGRAKDMGSAAVFVSLVNVPVVWGFVLLPEWIA